MKCWTPLQISKPASEVWPKPQPSPFRNFSSPIPKMKIQNSKFRIHHLLSPIRLSCLSAIFLIFFTACSTTRPRVYVPYSSAYTEPMVESRGLVAMSDQEARKQRAGTTKTRQTASSQVISKNGQIKKQTSVEEVVIETQVTTVIDAIPVPTADHDVR